MQSKEGNAKLITKEKTGRKLTNDEKKTEINKARKQRSTEETRRTSRKGKEHKTR